MHLYIRVIKFMFAILSYSYLVNETFYLIIEATMTSFVLLIDIVVFLFKVYLKGMAMFLEIEKSLMVLSNRYVGVTLNIQGSNMEFSDIVEMLKQEKAQFEVRYYMVIHFFFCCIFIKINNFVLFSDKSCENR